MPKEFVQVARCLYPHFAAIPGGQGKVFVTWERRPWPPGQARSKTRFAPATQRFAPATLPIVGQPGLGQAEVSLAPAPSAGSSMPTNPRDFEFSG